MKMSRYTLLALALFFIGCGSDNGIQSELPQGGQSGDMSADYFPLEEGMAWAYEDGTVSLRVIGTIRTINGPAYSLAGLMQDRILSKTTDGKVLELREGNWRLLFDLQADEKASWVIEAPSEQDDLLDGSTVTVESRSDVVTTPFAQFNNVLRFKVTPRAGLADAGITYMWFAPGVGLIKWSEMWFGGERVHNLSNFGIGTDIVTY